MPLIGGANTSNYIPGNNVKPWSGGTSKPRGNGGGSWVSGSKTSRGNTPGKRSRSAKTRKSRSFKNTPNTNTPTPQGKTPKGVAGKGAAAVTAGKGLKNLARGGAWIKTAGILLFFDILLADQGGEITTVPEHLRNPGESKLSQKVHPLLLLAVKLAVLCIMLK